LTGVPLVLFRFPSFLPRPVLITDTSAAVALIAFVSSIPIYTYHQLIPCESCSVRVFGSLSRLIFCSSIATTTHILTSFPNNKPSAQCVWVFKHGSSSIHPQLSSLHNPLPVAITFLAPAVVVLPSKFVHLKIPNSRPLQITSLGLPWPTLPNPKKPVETPTF
jgi:hypothetical protein